MTIEPRKNRPQFSLRGLLMSLTWLAFLLAICVQYQRAMSKQRETFRQLKATALPVILIENQAIDQSTRSVPAPRRHPVTR